MNFTLAQQTLVFLEAILLGVLGGVCYDVCRAVRRAFRAGLWGTALLDGVFWLVSLGALFCFAVTEAAAQARFYVPLGAGLGMALYFLCFSALALPALRALLETLRWAVRLPYRAGARAAGAAARLFDSRGRVVQILKKIKKKLPFSRRSG